jgi:hypothetical protein
MTFPKSSFSGSDRLGDQLHRAVDEPVADRLAHPPTDLVGSQALTLRTRRR